MSDAGAPKTEEKKQRRGRGPAKCRFCKNELGDAKTFAEHNATCKERPAPDAPRECRHCGLKVASAAEHTAHWEVCDKKPAPRLPKPLQCCACDKELPSADYSAAQKAKGAGKRKCKTCTAEALEKRNSENNKDGKSDGGSDKPKKDGEKKTDRRRYGRKRGGSGTKKASE